VKARVPAGFRPLRVAVAQQPDAPAHELAALAALRPAALGEFGLGVSRAFLVAVRLSYQLVCGGLVLGRLAAGVERLLATFLEQVFLALDGAPPAHEPRQREHREDHDDRDDDYQDSAHVSPLLPSRATAHRWIPGAGRPMRALLTRMRARAKSRGAAV